VDWQALKGRRAGVVEAVGIKYVEVGAQQRLEHAPQPLALEHDVVYVPAGALLLCTAVVVHHVRRMQEAGWVQQAGCGRLCDI